MLSAIATELICPCLQWRDIVLMYLCFQRSAIPTILHGGSTLCAAETGKVAAQSLSSLTSCCGYEAESEKVVSRTPVEESP